MLAGVIVVSRIGSALRRLVRCSCGRPWATVLVAVALALGGLALTSARLTFRTSTLALLPAGQPYVNRLLELEGEFGELDDLVVVVEAPSVPEAIMYASRLVRELRTRQVPLDRIDDRVDPKPFEGRALQYLSKARLTEIRDTILDHEDFLEAFAERPTIDRLIEGISSQVGGAFVAGFLDLGLEPPAARADLRIVRDLVSEMAARLDRPGAPYRSPFEALFPVGTSGDADTAGYYFSEDRRFLFILAKPRSVRGSFTADQPAIDGIRAVIAALAEGFPGVRVGVTGRAALATDEMATAFRDSRRATALALVLTLGLLLVAFRRMAKPLAMLVALGLAIIWTLGVATVVVGHLQLFSIMFVSIVIGVGIDYGIYLLFRYEEERALGRSVQEALELAAAGSGPGLLLSALTAGGTFYVLALTDFRGVQELGFIAGTATLFSLAAMFTVFPAMLMLLDRRRGGPPPAASPASEHVQAPVVAWFTAHPWTLVALTTGLTAVSLWGLVNVRFDYNLLNLQADGVESVRWERRILTAAGRSAFVALASAGSSQELRSAVERFSRLPSVSRVDSALTLIPSEQEEKRRIIASFAPVVAAIRVGAPSPVDIDRTVRACDTLRRRLGLAASEAPEGDARHDLQALVQDIARLGLAIRRLDRDAATAALGTFQTQIRHDFVAMVRRLQANLDSREMSVAQIPAELRRKFVSASGVFLIRIQPAVNIWDREGAERFVRDLRSVDPKVTGTPIVTYETIRLMERSYGEGTLYAIGLVVLVTGALLGRLRAVFLALSPLALGVVWTIGLMHFLGLTLTLGNVFGLPLVIGASAEYGINIVLRAMDARGELGRVVARSTLLAVLVSGLSTATGFGTLMLAAHRGIFGLGLLLTLGAAVSLLAALVVLPVLLHHLFTAS